MMDSDHVCTDACGVEVSVVCWRCTSANGELYVVGVVRAAHIDGPLGLHNDVVHSPRPTVWPGTKVSA